MNRTNVYNENDKNTPKIEHKYKFNNGTRIQNEQILPRGGDLTNE